MWSQDMSLPAIFSNLLSSAAAGFATVKAGFHFLQSRSGARNQS